MAEKGGFEPPEPSCSQLTHTLQVLESMEQAGITDREFLATTLIHDLGKLAILKGEKWENLEGGGKIPQGENVGVDPNGL